MPRGQTTMSSQKVKQLAWKGQMMCDIKHLRTPQHLPYKENIVFWGMGKRGIPQIVNVHHKRPFTTCNKLVDDWGDVKYILLVFRKLLHMAT